MHKQKNCPVCRGDITNTQEEFAVSPGLKAGWVVDMYLHGRREETRVEVVTVRLRGIDPVSQETTLSIQRFEGEAANIKPFSDYAYILGTVSEENSQDLEPGLRTGRFVVFGGRDGMECARSAAPLVHITATFCPFE